MLKIPYRVIMPNIDETISSMLAHEEIPELLAREKVTAVIRSLPAGQEIPWVLGADTIISYNGSLYGKPQDQDEAFNFLKDFFGWMVLIFKFILTGLNVMNKNIQYCLSIVGYRYKRTTMFSKYS